MKWFVITKYRYELKVPKGKNLFNLISEIIRPDGHDTYQPFWFKVDDFHKRALTV